jgi:AcrR family transcriptional regulator
MSPARSFLPSSVERIPLGEAREGRRERRKAETRRRLLSAARALFAERGYDATRPQDIARQADVAAGTFYVHFEDKRDAFLAFTEEAAHELMERVRPRASAARGFEDGLYRALEALLEYTDENPGVVRAAFADEAVIAAGPATGGSLRDRLASTLAVVIADGQRRGEIHRDYDPHVIAYGVVGLIQHALIFGAQRGLARAALLRNVTRFASRALRTTPLPEPEEKP